MSVKPLEGSHTEPADDRPKQRERGGNAGLSDGPASAPFFATIPLDFPAHVGGGGLQPFVGVEVTSFTPRKWRRVSVRGSSWQRCCVGWLKKAGEANSMSLANRGREPRHAGAQGTEWQEAVRHPGRSDGSFPD